MLVQSLTMYPQFLHSPGSRLALVCLLILLPAASGAPIGSLRPPGETNTPPKTAKNRQIDTSQAVAAIRDEGLNRSEAMETLSYLTEVIGPRLTGSPALKRANEWTRERLSCWGLTNAHLEAWGPFGRGWSLRRFSAQLIEPQAIPLIAYPNAWSPGLEKPLTAEVVYLDTQTNSDLARFEGKLKGKIVLSGQIRELSPRFDPIARRLAETNLLSMANAGPSFSMGRRPFFPRSGSQPVSSEDRPSEPSRASRTNALTRLSQTSPGETTNTAASSGPGEFRRGGFFRGGSRNLAFLAKERAALVVSPSIMGDGGTVFVGAASVPMPEGQRFSTNMPRAWSTNAPGLPPQITLASEDYNRLVRMSRQGEHLKMAVDFQAQFHDADLMAYNTIAEIPGTDLKDQIVMLGAHLDSFQAGTGATDNAVGVAACMEAVRILRKLELQPRRTIRIGLWGGEEQGLLGSRAYVARHFGYYTNEPASTERPTLRSPKDQAESSEPAMSAPTNSSSIRRLVKLGEYKKLSAYFNLDNGAGKIRGVYMQGNEAVRPLFRRWLEPFRELQAETLSLSPTSGTDHTSFDAIGLPGFQFIQDPLDYFNRTHHSNEDVLDRVPPDDLKQASVILAAFVYNAAMLNEPLPRKPLEEDPEQRGGR